MIKAQKVAIAKRLIILACFCLAVLKFEDASVPTDMKGKTLLYAAIVFRFKVT
jgi:hypothetical protein